jgi:peptidoglycan hydrolase-like protein with peptidoglycan-binding domain
MKLRHFTLTLLASAALAMPVMVPAMAQNNPQNQAPQAQQPNSTMQQPNQPMNRRSQQQTNRSSGRMASKRAVSPQQLGRTGVRKVQQALDKDGFHAGRADGIYGPKTRTALQGFQKSKGITSSGRLTPKTLSDLGVRVASVQGMRNRSGNNMNNMKNMNMSAPTQNNPAPGQNNR